MAVEEKYIWAYALKNATEHEGKAQAGSVISGLFNCGLEKDKIKDEMPAINEVIKKVNSLAIEEQKTKYKDYEQLIGHRPEREGLPELEGVDPKKGVIMRFRPAPSGPMHVGHIISNLPSSLYVEKYGGKFYIIIDDTNPDETLGQAYENLKKDCDWIFGNVSEYINASDRMELYYKYAEELVKKKKAYVCTCDAEEFKELVVKKKPCPCRELDTKEVKERWSMMLDGKYKQGEAVLRFKSDLSLPNPALRDFPLARINFSKHPLQGNKYRVWPLMNLSVAVDDMELKMTHIIRGKDHRDNALRQKLIFEVFAKDFPYTYFIGRVKFTDLVLSKRKLNALINQGEYEGAEDARLPTVASLRKRGFTREEFSGFVVQRGLTEVDKVISEKDFFKAIKDFA